MNKFVKGEDEKWKMPAKKRIQTRLVSASSKRVLDFRFVPQLNWRCSGKIETHKLLRSNHPYYRHVAKHLWREPLIIKLENAFHIWINIGYICEHTLSAMSRVASVRVLQTATYNRNFIVLLPVVGKVHRSSTWVKVQIRIIKYYSSKSKSTAFSILLEWKYKSTKIFMYLSKKVLIDRFILQFYID